MTQSIALASTPIGPVQPGTAPLSTVTATPSGDIGSGTGLTYSFTGLSPSVVQQFQTLEWGPASPSAIQLSLDGNAGFTEAGQTLTFDPGDSNLAGGVAMWTGSSQYPLAQPPGTTTVPTRLVMTTTPLPINAISGYGDGATVSVAGDFNVNLLFEVLANGSWTPAKDYFNAQQNIPGNTIQSSFQGGFFYTLASAPIAMVSPPSPFSFGNQPVGQPSTAQTFTVQNTGNAGLVMAMPSVTTTGDFAVSSDTCSGNTVAPGGMCTIGVTFTPTVTGTRPGTLTISDNAADSPQQILLTGTGTQPALSLNTPSLGFGNQFVNTTSFPPVDVIVTNTGTGDLHVGAVSITGGNAGDFAASSGCGTVPANGTCTISVTFTPSASGARSATLNIPSDDPNNPVAQVSLSGTGFNPRLKLTPNPMNFGNVLVGQSSTMTLTLTNAGSDPTHLTGQPAAGGPNPGDFVLNGSSVTCPSDSSGPFVPAGGSCSVTVTFTPGAVGARSATYTFSNNSSDGPQTLTLTGNGASPGISVSPASLTFPSQGVGTTSAAQPVVVTSSGSSALTVSSVTVTGPFQVTDGCSGAGPIAPNGTCTVQVAFKPTATGGASGTLTINSDSGTKTVALSGTGVAVADLGISIGASPNPVKAGAKATLTYTVTLKNAGPNAASGIVISDPLSSFTQFQSLTMPAGLTCATPAVGASGTVKCSLSTLNAGASIQLKIVVKVVATKAMTINDTVTVTSQSVDPDLADNQATASTVVK